MRFLFRIESLKKGLIMEINPFICDSFARGKVSCRKKQDFSAVIRCILIKKVSLITKGQAKL